MLDSERDLYAIRICPGLHIKPGGSGTKLRCQEVAIVLHTLNCGPTLTFANLLLLKVPSFPLNAYCNSCNSANWNHLYPGVLPQGTSHVLSSPLRRKDFLSAIPMVIYPFPKIPESCVILLLPLNCSSSSFSSITANLEH